MEHLILNEGSDSAALAKVALKALREARSSKTSSSGSMFVSDGQTDDDGIALGTGTIINGVNGGIQPWVGDTTPPGKPTGITAESHNGAVWVSWDGTLEGGIPADFDHVRFTAVDGSKTVDMGQLRAAGKVTAAELTAGDTVVVTAVAFDDAHDEHGNSTPNASPISDAVPVIVQGAVDPNDVEKAQADAQTALNQAGQAKSVADGAQSTADTANTTAQNATTIANAAKEAAQGAQTTADGKNKIFSSASEPSHTGIVPGDLWFQLDQNKNVTGIQVWNGSAFTDMVLLGNKLLVASSVGTTQIADNAITTGKISANAVTALQIAAQSITGDKLDVGSVASAIVTSGKFQTATSGARVVMDSNGIRAYDATGNNTFQIEAETGKASLVGGMQTALSGKRVSISQSGDVGKVSLLDGDSELTSLTFIDDTESSGYVYTGLYTGQNGQFLQFATLVDTVNHQPDPLQYAASFTSNGRMFISAPYGINVNGTWFANDETSLPPSPNVAGGAGTKGFAGGKEYVFDGAGTWVPQNQPVTLQNGFYYFETHGVVTVGVDGAKTGPGSWDSTDAPFTLPERLCPPRTVLGACIVANGASHTKRLTVRPTGVVTLSNLGDSGSADLCYGSVTYAV